MILPQDRLQQIFRAVRAWHYLGTHSTAAMAWSRELGCRGTDSVPYQLFTLCSRRGGTLKVVILGAGKDAGLWGHGLPLRQRPDEDGDRPFLQKPPKKNCLSLCPKKKVRLMLPYFLITVGTESASSFPASSCVLSFHTSRGGRATWLRLSRRPLIM